MEKGFSTHSTEFSASFGGMDSFHCAPQGPPLPEKKKKKKIFPLSPFARARVTVFLVEWNTPPFHGRCAPRKIPPPEWNFEAGRPKGAKGVSSGARPGRARCAP